MFLLLLHEKESHGDSKLYLIFQWRDGLFTHILRRIVDNVRGEINKRQWIIFDGDVDPEWVENLNSVLDDNKLLTLPNGERLSIPANVRIMFEVHTLKYATLATVSRCGMVWFSEDILTTEMVMANYLTKLRNVSLDEGEEDLGLGGHGGESEISLLPYKLQLLFAIPGDVTTIGARTSHIEVQRGWVTHPVRST